jgi:hypothetical protein
MIPIFAKMQKVIKRRPGGSLMKGEENIFWQIFQAASHFFWPAFLEAEKE